MACLIDDAHPALPQPFFQLVAAIEDWFTADRCSCRSAVIGTMQYVIGETTATGWAFFHSLVLITQGNPSDFPVFTGILAAGVRAGKDHDWSATDWSASVSLAAPLIRASRSVQAGRWRSSQLLNHHIHQPLRHHNYLDDLVTVDETLHLSISQGQGA